MKLLLIITIQALLLRLSAASHAEDITVYGAARRTVLANKINFGASTRVETPPSPQIAGTKQDLATSVSMSGNYTTVLLSNDRRYLTLDLTLAVAKEALAGPNDIQLFVQIYTNYDEAGSPYGSLNLKTEEWESVTCTSPFTTEENLPDMAWVVLNYKSTGEEQEIYNAEGKWNSEKVDGVDHQIKDLA